ncbi:MAG: T9SS type A sorting domain-containing protein [Bacteroidetes bacterium]|nr:T9SS type A sorting domain-containing protein [Bacteroidota bacterium]
MSHILYFYRQVRFQLRQNTTWWELNGQSCNFYIQGIPAANKGLNGAITNTKEMRVYDARTFREYEDRRISLDQEIFEFRSIEDYLIIRGNFTKFGQLNRDGFALIDLPSFQIRNEFPNLPGPIGQFDIQNDKIYFLCDSGSVNLSPGSRAVGKCFDLTNNQYTPWHIEIVSSYGSASRLTMLNLTDSGTLYATIMRSDQMDSIAGLGRMPSKVYMLDDSNSSVINNFSGEFVDWVRYSNGRINVHETAINYSPQNGQYTISLLNKKSGQIENLGITKGQNLTAYGNKNKILLYGQGKFDINGTPGSYHVIDTNGNLISSVSFSENVQEAILYDTMVILKKKNINNAVTVYGLQSGQQLSYLNFSGQVTDIEVFDDTLYLAGAFTQLYSPSIFRYGIASFSLPDFSISNLGASRELPWLSAGMDMCITRNFIHLVGGFPNAVGVNEDVFVTKYVKVDRNTGKPIQSKVTFNDHMIPHLTSSGSNVLFMSGNGITLDREPIMAAYAMNLSNGEFYPWKFPSNGNIEDIQVIHSKIFVAGNFTRIGRRNVKFLTYFNGFNLQADSIPIAFNGTKVSMIEAHNNELYLKGDYTIINGLSRNGMAKISLTDYSLGQDLFSSSSLRFANSWQFSGNYLYGSTYYMYRFNLLTHTEERFTTVNDFVCFPDKLVRVGLLKLYPNYNVWDKANYGYGIQVQRDSVITPKLGLMDYAPNRIVASGNQFLYQSEAINTQYKAIGVAAYKISTGELIELGLKANAFSGYSRIVADRIQHVSKTRLLFHATGTIVSTDSTRNDGWYMYDLVNKRITQWNCPVTKVSEIFSAGDKLLFSGSFSYSLNGKTYQGLVVTDTSTGQTMQPLGGKIRSIFSRYRGNGRDIVFMDEDSSPYPVTRMVQMNDTDFGYTVITSSFHNRGMSYYVNDSFVFVGYYTDTRLNPSSTYPYFEVYRRSDWTRVLYWYSKVGYRTRPYQMKYKDGKLYILVSEEYYVPNHPTSHEGISAYVRVLDPLTLKEYNSMPPRFAFDAKDFYLQDDGLTVGGSFYLSTFSDRRYLQKKGSNGSVKIDLPETSFCGFPDTLSFDVYGSNLQKDSNGIQIELFKYINGNWTSLQKYKDTLISQVLHANLFFSSGDTGRYLILADLNDVSDIRDGIEFQVFEEPVAQIHLLSDSIQCLKGNRFELTDSSGFSAGRYWTMNGMVQDSAATFIWSNAIADTLTIRLELENQYHCKASDSMQVMVLSHPMVSHVALQLDSVCPGATTQIFADSINSGWNYYLFENSHLSDSNMLGQFVVQDSADYHMKITNAFGCESATDTTHFTWNPVPAAPVIMGSDTVRALDSIWYSTSLIAGSSMNWNANGFALVNTGDSVQFIWASQGRDTIYAQETNSFGCISPLSNFPVVILPPLIPDSLSVSPDTLFANAYGDTLAIQVIANIPWKAKQFASWVNLSDTFWYGSKLIHARVGGNSGAGQRSSWIVFQADTLQDSVFVLQNTHTGIENPAFGQVKVYPNPSSGSFNLINKSDWNFQFKIVDMNGKLILQGESKSSENRILACEDWKPGVYTLILLNGEETHSIKLILLH